MQHSTIVRPVAAFLAALLAAGSAALAPNASLRKDPASENKAGISYTDGSLVLAENGKLNCKITAVKEDAGEAAQIFLDMAGKVLGTEVKPDENAAVSIIFDYGESEYKFDERFDNLKTEGFIIAEHEGDVIFYSKTLRGLKYAAYSYFEDFAGVRYLTSDVDYIPDTDALVIPKDTFDLQNPAFERRQMQAYDTTLGDYSLKHKLGNGEIVLGNNFAHTVSTLMNSEVYYDEHPEWFCLDNGKRLKYDRGLPAHPCYSNNEMVAEAVKNLGKLIEKKPDVKYWAVAQNDLDIFCKCDNCKRLNEEAGGTLMGSVLNLVNAAAKAYPDKIIVTMAYADSRTPPKNVEVAENIRFLFTTNDEDYGFELGVDDDKNAKTLEEQIEGYAAMTDEMYYWHHNTDFANFHMPFPDTYYLQNNIQFFHKNKGNYVFMQGHEEKGGELWALRWYLISELLWDPYIDFEATKNEFLELYYGAAAPYINEYINTLDKYYKEAHAEGEYLNMYAVPAEQSWTQPDKMLEYIAIIDKALAAVEGDEELTSRVEEEKMGLVYCYMFQVGKKDRQEYIDFFKRVADEHGITSVAGLDNWVRPITVEIFYEKSKIK